MDSFFVAVEHRDVLWLMIAFLCGFAAHRINLPPLVGFLASGFILNAFGAESSLLLAEMADMGVTLLLFTIGLKLRISNLFKREIWAVASLHMLLVTLTAGVFVLFIGLFSLSYFAVVELSTALIIGFSLSFSSTVFAVKTLNEHSADSSRVGQITIGVLIIQDIAAVTFLAASTGKLPSLAALGLIVLPFLRRRY